MPRDVASRAAKQVCDDGFGVNKSGLAVYLDFASAIERYGKSQASARPGQFGQEPGAQVGEKVVEQKYGNLFEM